MTILLANFVGEQPNSSGLKCALQLYNRLIFYCNLSKLWNLILLNVEQAQINKQQHLVNKGQKKPFPEGLYFIGYSGGSQMPSLNVVFRHHINQM